MDVEAAVLALIEFNGDLETLDRYSRFDNPNSFPDYAPAKLRRDRNLTLICGIADQSGVPEASEKIRYGITNLYATGIAIAKMDEIIGHLAHQGQRCDQVV